MDKSTKEKIVKAIVCCIAPKGRCSECSYNRDEKGNLRISDVCRADLISDAINYIDDLTNVIELLEAEK